MKIFTVNFKAGTLDLGVIITPLDENNQKFKVEMITGERSPVILTRSGQDNWNVENTGKWSISDEEYQKLGKAIDAYLNNLFCMRSMLVLTDFSDAALNAAYYAAALSHQLGTTCMFLYHSYRSSPVNTYMPMSIPPEAIDTQKESLEHLNKLKDKLQVLVNKETVIQIRTDERPLVSAVNLLSEQQHIGLIVMGITGKSNLEQILIGSNAIKIAKESSVPLLIIPKDAKFESIKRVLFACDLKKVLKTTPVQTIKSFIHALGAKLFILNVADNQLVFNADNTEEQLKLHELWDSENAEYHYIDSEDTAEGIMKFADEHDIQLVITVPKKYGFFESLFHRTVTKKLSYHSHIPLLLLEEGI
ncbi:universal stress protein [Daejeonella oryzae]|uniref:universal stress protein n=1 Tax=Daejeonella oryzae TaxID=1122943 RepID=UPI00047C431E|nr:universal stress protein [Daejeonella oryzae]